MECAGCTVCGNDSSQVVHSFSVQFLESFLPCPQHVITLSLFSFCASLNYPCQPRMTFKQPSLNFGLHSCTLLSWADFFPFSFFFPFPPELCGVLLTHAQVQATFSGLGLIGNELHIAVQSFHDWVWVVSYEFVEEVLLRLEGGPLKL